MEDEGTEAVAARPWTVVQHSTFHFARESFVLLFWLGAWQLLVLTGLTQTWWFALFCIATGVVGHTTVFLIGRDLGAPAAVHGRGARAS